AFLDEHLHQFGLNVRHLREPAFRLLDAVVQLVVRHDLNVPTNQLARQPDVLAALADRQGQLIFLHQHDRPAQPGVEEYFLDGRRLQGVGDHDLQRIVPADDVDALVVQLVHDVLDARAADADAGADAIDLHVDAGDGDLRAVAGLARHGAN